MNPSVYPLFSLALTEEEDVVLARHRARGVAAALGFDGQDQIRIATAVSEIARNAYAYAGGGRVEFAVEGNLAPQLLTITVRDRGAGIPNLDEILSGRYRSKTGMGVGIIGARRLLDRVDIESSPSGTTVTLRKLLPQRGPLFSGPQLETIAHELASARGRTAMEEVRQQNGDLMTALSDLRKRQDELETLNRELEYTNRGVVALYAEPDEKAEHLRRADDMKTKFLSNMTHEFRTPLNSILALSKLLLEETDGPLTDEQRKQVSFVRKAADGLSELVNDLLDIAKIEAGKTTVRSRQFTVSDLFSALRGMLRPLLINSSVTLSFDEPDLPEMISDEAKVSQILRNFISNALKFTELGTVHVSARHDEHTDVIVFSVSDTGIGIAPENQETIFKEFAQIENPLQGRTKGTGLGLPLAARLVDLLGGKLTLESTLGEGSTFIAAIPRVFAVPSGPLAGLSEGAPEDARIPVLFVDDDVQALALYEKYLEGTRFRVLPARDVREARYGLKFRPRVIVLDILLVGDDTWALLAELKSDPTMRHVPIVIITAVEDQHKAIALGANAYAVKPTSREWLVSTLSDLTTNWNILVIDDDEATRYVLRRALAELNCSVSEAATGADGLRKAQTDAPDLVFLDLNLPEMNGGEVLQRLKDDPATAEMPVIIYTSRAVEGLARELHGQASLILSKQHYDRDALITAVRQLLPIGAA